jgi:hypothetical protein
MSLRGRKNFLVGLSISSSAGEPAIRGDAAFGRSRSACKHDLAAADACCDRTLSRLTAGLFSLRTGHASRCLQFIRWQLRRLPVRKRPRTTEPPRNVMNSRRLSSSPKPDHLRRISRSACGRCSRPCGRTLVHSTRSTSLCDPTFLLDVAHLSQTALGS